MTNATRTERPSLSGADIGLLLLRLGLGVIFVAHGGQKLFGWWGGRGLAATVQGFETGLGIPAPLAYLAVFTEFFGGLAVIVGVLARLAALGLGVTMIVAMAKVHLAHGFFLANPSKPDAGSGIEFNLALLAMSLAVLLAGPGRLAIADLEPRLLRRGSGKT